jgi:nucleoid-associated protein YgaU
MRKVARADFPHLIAGMSLLRAVPALAALLACSGCGYVHFGRLPASTAPAGDAQLATAYSDLRTEHKILQQELVLVRKEGDTLRAALDKNAAGSPDLAARLQETTRELAALRASYARLQAERTAPNTPDTAAAVLARAQLEEKLAATLRDFTQLQEENSRLRADVTRTREENTVLTSQLKTATAQNAQTQAALAQLSTELLAQKEARARADQQAEAARTQLAIVVSRTADLAVAARQNPDAKPKLADARDTSATGANTIAAPVRIANAPTTDTPVVAELRTSPERLRAAAERNKAAAEKASAAPAPKTVRTHTVRPNETLEFIARRYYGDAEKWLRIYAANNSQLSGGRPIKPGMELVIPED